jgi:hypothetical protein
VLASWRCCEPFVTLRPRCSTDRSKNRAGSIVEIWLRTNTRAVLLGTILPLIVGALGLVLCLGVPGREPATWMRAVGTSMIVVAAITVALLLLQLRQPRLAYSNGQLLVWLRSGAPICVPIAAVECFWLGHGASLLPGKRNERTETQTIIMRIADKAVDWRQQDVKAQLGAWCDGYVTIRGTWCEPLNIDVVNRLNRRLAEVSAAAST